MSETCDLEISNEKNGSVDGQTSISALFHDDIPTSLEYYWIYACFREDEERNTVLTAHGERPVYYFSVDDRPPSRHHDRSGTRATTSTLTSTSKFFPPMSNERKARKAVIVGAGPVGCLAALALAKEGWQVEIYEARPGESRNRQLHSPIQFSYDLTFSLYA